MTVRKLDKIEKEMGYCEIKLEKERRLRRQIDYLQAELEVLERVRGLNDGTHQSLVTLPFEQFGQQIAIERQAERQSRDAPGKFFLRAREQFVAAGLIEMVQAESETLKREVEEIEAKLGSFHSFGRKRQVLEEEKTVALQSVAPQLTVRVRKLNDDFKRTEQLWNSLSEDAINLDEAVFYLARNVDYLRSSRSFLVAAKGAFDVETWIEDRYTSNLFRHSNVGRAKEMIDGACRNLKLAQKELVCVFSLDFEIESVEPWLVKALSALFDDIFLDGRLERTIQVIESWITASERRLAKTRQKREQLHKKLERAERSRVDLFQRIGGERRTRVAAG